MLLLYQIYISLLFLLLALKVNVLKVFVDESRLRDFRNHSTLIGYIAQGCYAQSNIISSV